MAHFGYVATSYDSIDTLLPGPPPVSGKMTLLIADKILDNRLVQQQLEKLQKKRKKGSYIYDAAKSTLRDLPIEILVNNIFPLLQSPDLICLALTCKELAAKALVVDPSVDNNVPVVVVKTYRNGTVHHYKHFSPGFEITSSFLCLTSRKQLLWQLNDYFPRGYRLCWVRNRYSRSSSSKWHTFSLTQVPRNEDHHMYLDRMFPHRVHCHHSCKPNFMGLKQYVKETLGAGYLKTNYHTNQSTVEDLNARLGPSTTYVLSREENALAHPGVGHGEVCHEYQWFEKSDGLWVQCTLSSPSPYCF